MINKRLINLLQSSKKHIKQNVIFQIICLVINIGIMFIIGNLILDISTNNINVQEILFSSGAIFILMICRFFGVKGANKEAFLGSKSVKKILREKIYNKLISLGNGYINKFSTSEVVQASVEGVEQLESYFGSYLPQLYYSMIAPVILFVVLSFVSIKSALILFLCVPLIPISIMAVNKIAKKLLKKYWTQYSKLGNRFLENLQGLTLLKVYKADEFKSKQMNKEAEKFRKITMKVLSMQLNSIIIMDIIAYGGAALGVIISLIEFKAGNIDLKGTFLVIMLSAEFFLPLRLLGSYFHVAMNGIAASDKIFELLDIKEEKIIGKTSINKSDIQINNLYLSYNENKNILKGINMSIKENSFISIVGESGSGKSTIADIIMGRNNIFEGQVKIGQLNIKNIDEESLMNKITYIGINSYIFSGTVYDNLIMANKEATEDEMWKVLKKVRLHKFLLNENGLLTNLDEKGMNFSGGQRQRLAIARALLKDSDIYIFDEATSNIDIESEERILEALEEIRSKKTIIFISHRLANAKQADEIYVLENGQIKGFGNHKELISKSNSYKKLWDVQKKLEMYDGSNRYEA